nr:hypothetical protein [Bacillus cereus]
MILEKIQKDLTNRGITNRQLADLLGISHSKVINLFQVKENLTFLFMRKY